MSLACKTNNTSLTLVKNLRKISIKEIKKLGYDLTENQIPIGNKPVKYGILELESLEAKKKNIVSFCLLYSVDEKLSIILPKPYAYYKTHPTAYLDCLR